MTALYLYDDQRARAFEPFALSRPVAELRAGAELIRHRWELALGARAAGFVGAPHLAEFEEPGAPTMTTGQIPAGAIIANARCVPPLSGVPHDADVWTCAGRTAAVRLTSAVAIDALADGSATLEPFAEAREPVTIRGRWLEHVWDLVAQLPAQLAEDIAVLGPRLDPRRPADAIVLGTHAVYVEDGALVEPQVCFDATAGPILVRQGAAVLAFTRLVGPCVVGSQSAVTSGRIAGCAIGEACRVHGDVSHTIFIGHANKAHEGFVGHSVVGRWVNLGAGTTTSNLKNTYGAVEMWTPAGMEDTGLLNLGTMFGDHARTGIGLCLTTGTVIGAGANVYGGTMPSKIVAPFSWGEAPAYTLYRPEKFLEVAERVMERRDVRLNDRGRRWLSAVHEARWRAEPPA